MYTENEKVYFTGDDFEVAVQDIVNTINKDNNSKHIVTLYRGGLPLGVRLSNQCNLPLTVLDYQRLDGKGANLKEVSIMKNADISSSETLYLVDDIADEGITLRDSIAYLNEHFPNNKLVVYTIFGNNKKHDPKWKYTYEHKGDWICFGPWEGYA